MATKRVRWECPNGCPSVLGSTRPAADSTTRFCLSCSATVGRLVRRSAPALERKRSARSAAAADKARLKRERQARAERDRCVVTSSDGERIDLAEEMREMMSASQELRDRRREHLPRALHRSLPSLTVRRGNKSHVSGHSQRYVYSITLTVGSGADAVEIREVLLHELVHAVLPGDVMHGSMFRTALCRAARELWGTTVHPDDAPDAYGLDHLICKQLRSDK